MDMPDKIWVQGSLSATLEKLPEKYFPDPQIPYIKADLAQSLADALESTLADFKAHTQWNGEELDTIKQARAALANYRKGE